MITIYNFYVNMFNSRFAFKTLTGLMCKVKSTLNLIRYEIIVFCFAIIFFQLIFLLLQIVDIIILKM
jgi:hypothetical protein